MPSPVGHILGGAAVYLAGANTGHRSRVTFAMTFVGSILPDFDFLPGILIGDPGAFHHGVSHSLAFALLFGALVYVFLRRYLQSEIARRVALLGTLAYVFHAVLDVVSVNQGARGIPFIWPLSNVKFGINLNLFGHFHHGGLDEGIWSIFRWDNLAPLTREFVLMGIPVLLLFLWREGRDRRSTPRPSEVNREWI